MSIDKQLLRFNEIENQFGSNNTKLSVPNKQPTMFFTLPCGCYRVEHFARLSNDKRGALTTKEKNYVVFCNHHKYEN